jgi:ABC-type transport system involved in multi-copper enzyme maturation permease subunit
MLLLTIGYGAAALAGQDEDGTLALIAALPVRRRTIIFQKAWAMAVQALLLAATVTLCVVIGPGFQLAVSVGAISAIRPGRYLSLFYWSVGNDQITRGVSPGDFTILIAVGLCALAASVAALRNADLN